MTKLQKKAWQNIIGVTVCLIVVMPILYLLKRLDMKGGDYLGNLVVVCVVVVIIHMKRVESALDEREKDISIKAYTISTYVFSTYAALSCFIPFFVLGARAVIPVFYLPTALMVGLFIAQLTMSAVILFQCNTLSMHLGGLTWQKVI